MRECVRALFVDEPIFLCDVDESTKVVTTVYGLGVLVGTGVNVGGTVAVAGTVFVGVAVGNAVGVMISSAV
jgi:hypothetical protein